MANEKNLIPGAHRLTVDEQSNGGKASAAARRERKLLTEAVRHVANLEVSEEMRAQQMRAMGIADDQLTNAMAVAVGIIKRAIKGDPSAFNAVRDILGEKQKDEIELSTFGKLEIGFVEVEHTPSASEDEIDDI